MPPTAHAARADHSLGSARADAVRAYHSACADRTAHATRVTRAVVVESVERGQQ